MLRMVRVERIKEMMDQTERERESEGELEKGDREMDKADVMVLPTVGDYASWLRVRVLRFLFTVPREADALSFFTVHNFIAYPSTSLHSSNSYS